MHAYTPGEWSSFFTAPAGASAALAELEFVGVSINVRAILETPGLVGGALEALVLLVSVLLASVFGLVPDTVGGYFAGLFDAWVLLIEIIR